MTTTGADHSDIHGMAEVDVIGPGFNDLPGDPASGKPYLRVRFPNGVAVNLSATLADLIGGVGRGALARYKDLGLQ